MACRSQEDIRSLIIEIREIIDSMKASFAEISDGLHSVLDRSDSVKLQPEATSVKGEDSARNTSSPDARVAQESTASSNLTSVSKVFGNSKLLEAILLQLPTRDLLLAQRVSKTFKEAIDTSKAIQQALFLTPAPESLRQQPVLNPIFFEGSKRWRPIYFSIVGSYFPLSRIIVTPHNLNGERSLEVELWSSEFPDPDCTAYVSGPWEKMLFSQPPRDTYVVARAKGKADRDFETGDLPFGSALRTAAELLEAE